jgi:hypothetical protein
MDRFFFLGIYTQIPTAPGRKKRNFSRVFLSIKNWNTWITRRVQSHIQYCCGHEPINQVGFSDDTNSRMPWQVPCYCWPLAIEPANYYILLVFNCYHTCSAVHQQWVGGVRVRKAVPYSQPNYWRGHSTGKLISQSLLGKQFPTVYPATGKVTAQVVVQPIIA